jgi:hypothetical protein
MTYPDPDPRIASPIPVEVKNWAEPLKPPCVKKTTLKTYAIAVSGFVQISDFEPSRLRMAIYVVDSAVSLSTSVPTITPDVSSSSVAPQGACLFAGALPYEFFGPDPFWINSLGGLTRVVVVKEYGV